MADQTPNEIIDAETAKVEAALAGSFDYAVGPYDSLDELVDTYDGLQLGTDDCLHGGSEYGFLRLIWDQEVPIPKMLPNIIHGKTIFFLVPSRIDWPRHLRRNILSFLPRGIVDEGTVFFSQRGSGLFNHRHGYRQYRVD